MSESRLSCPPGPRIARVPALLLLWALAGCGGGGGSPTAAAPPSPPVQGTAQLEMLFGATPNGAGYVDGPGTFARFNRPQGIALDAAGILYVADTENSAIRKVARDGTVGTVLSNGDAGFFRDASGLVGSLNRPAGVAVDPFGNVLVADTRLNVIRMIGPAGVLPTFAGDFSAGSRDGIGTAAQFNEPTGLVFDGAGNLWVADTGNSTIRRISPARVVTTAAGAAGEPGSRDGPGTTARLRGPRALAADRLGNIYFADTGNHTIRRIALDGTVSTIAGTAEAFGYADGAGASARFLWPTGIAIDLAGNVYVADSGNVAIRKITPAGEVSTLAGMPGASEYVDGPRSVARFASVSALAMGPDSTLYVTDSAGGAVRTVSAEGEVRTLAGVKPGGAPRDGFYTDARFAAAGQLAADGAGSIYATDGNAVRRIAPSGEVTTLATGFNQLHGITMDRGVVVVADFLFCGLSPGAFCGYRVRLSGITPGGNTSEYRILGSSDGTGTDFWNAAYVAADESGRLYLSDTGRGLVRRLADGDLTVFAGSVSEYGAADGLGGAARFRGTSDLAIDRDGTLYVCDTENHTIRKISPAGMVTTVAGTPHVAGHADGVGPSAKFDTPRGISVDSSGNIYVADQGNHVVRKITPGGIVSTIVGVPRRAGFIPGPLPGLLESPRDVLVVGNDLYISMMSGIAVVRNRP